MELVLFDDFWIVFHLLFLSCCLVFYFFVHLVGSFQSVL